MLVVSVIGRPVQAEGHLFPYHFAVSEACALAGMLHVVLADRAPSNNGAPWPSNWHPLPPGSAYRSVFTRAFWRRKLPELVALCEGKLLFLLESFEGRAIPALASAAADFRKVAEIVLMPILRTGSQLSTAFRWVTRENSLLWQGVKFHLSTDSIQICESVANRYGLTVRLLPIPHLSGPETTPVAPTLPIKIWFPGGPREEKGLSVVKRLAPKIGKGDLGCTLLVDRRAFEDSVLPAGVSFINGPLSPGDYQKAMNSSDAVLLPYNRERYREATSGILFEAVTAGKVPFVTSGTWMASQLTAHNLSDLTFDWSGDSAFSRFSELTLNPQVRARLKSFKDTLIENHGAPAFAAALKDIRAEFKS